MNARTPTPPTSARPRRSALAHALVGALIGCLGLTTALRPEPAHALPRIYALPSPPPSNDADWVSSLVDRTLDAMVRGALRSSFELEIRPTRAGIDAPNDWLVPTLQALYRDRRYSPIFVADGALTRAGETILAHLQDAQTHGIPAAQALSPTLVELVETVHSGGRADTPRLGTPDALREELERDLSDAIAQSPFLLASPPLLHQRLQRDVDRWLNHDEHALPQVIAQEQARRLDASYALELELLQALWNYAAELKLANPYYAPNNPAMHVAYEHLQKRGYSEISDGTASTDAEFVAPVAQVVRTPEEWQIDEFDWLLAQAEGALHFDDALKALAPQGGDYPKLREAHARYEALAEAGGWDALPLRLAGKNLQDPDAAAALHVRMRQEGYLSSLNTDPESHANSQLRDALLLWKRDHQLPVDDTLDELTLLALNIPVQERLAQLQIAMRKIRFARYAHDEKREHIRVNIPAFEASLWDQGELLYRWEVMVGKVRGNGINNTPEMSALMTEIELNPYWYPPRRLMRADAPTRYMPPGPSNPMGSAKFLFPNEDAIYMHDTNQPQWFDVPFRAFSAGCIRVQGAEELAALLISRDKGHALDDTRAWVEQRLRRGQRERYYLKRPLPVHVEYRTAFFDAEGRLRFGVDLYDLEREETDLALAEILARHPHLRPERPSDRHARNYRLSRRQHELPSNAQALGARHDGG